MLKRIPLIIRKNVRNLHDRKLPVVILPYKKTDTFYIGKNSPRKADFFKESSYIKKSKKLIKTEAVINNKKN